MSNAEKQHFISGYKYAGNDISEILDIAIAYVKENPENAVQGMESLKKLYDYEMISPDSLVRGIDSFYKEGDNRSSSLSRAVSAAKNHLR